MKCFKYNTKDITRINKTLKNPTLKKECEKNTHIQIEGELYSPEISMVDKAPRKKSVEIRTINFHDDDLMNYRIENTGKLLVASQPTPPLYSVVYPISEANPSTPFNLLIRFKQKKVMGIE